MFDKSYLLPREALPRLLDALPGSSPGIERISLEESYGRVVASVIISPEDLPGFSRSTVDGYAVNASDTFGARETSPAYLTLDGEVFMGEAPSLNLLRGQAAKIPTGGMLPGGADAVVMLEYVNPVSEAMIEVLRSVAPHENVIAKGEDVRCGERVLSMGHRLRPQDVGALAGLGITEVEVFRRPVVAIISTGDEIVPAHSPAGPGQVRDINSFTLWGMIRRHGGVPVKKGIIADDYMRLKEVIDGSLNDSDIVLISGGTSAGVKDMTFALINEAGEPGVLFHGVALKPGKPMIGGVVGGRAVLGLPGHPAAVAVCFDLFIRPLIEKLGGVVPGHGVEKTVKATMAKTIASAAGREDHIRVSIEVMGEDVRATPVLGKSGLITTLVKADGVVVIPSGKLGLDAGEEVTVRLFE